MPAFELDPRLRADCHHLADIEGFTCLLHRNAEVAWFILVPHVRQTELYQLEAGMQVQIYDHVNHVSRFIQSHFDCDKINVASIGNVVSQMHVHVIGRRHDDAWWPDVVWGKTSKKTYSAARVEMITADFLAALRKQGSI